MGGGLSAHFEKLIESYLALPRPEGIGYPGNMIRWNPSASS